MAWGGASVTSIAVFTAGLLLVLAFVVIERRAAEPVLPGWAVSRRILAAGNLVSFAVGALLFGLTTYVPTFVQGVLGTGALVAGFALAALLTVGWPIAAALSGKVYLRIGFRSTMVLGAAVRARRGAAACSPSTVTPPSCTWRCRASSWASASASRWHPR